MQDNPDVWYMISFHKMLVSEEADIVPTLTFLVKKQDMPKVDAEKIAAMLDGTIDFKDSPFTGLRPMTEGEIEKWRTDREEELGAIEDTIRPVDSPLN